MYDMIKETRPKRTQEREVWLVASTINSAKFLMKKNDALISKTLKNTIGFTYMTLRQTSCVAVVMEHSLVVCTIP